MQLGRVVGHATATVKHPALVGRKLLVVQPLMLDGQTPDGDPQLTVDERGAGVGETVIMTSDGRAVRESMGDRAPVRWTVMGIRDA